jgi:hypothetical protein
MEEEWQPQSRRISVGKSFDVCADANVDPTGDGSYSTHFIEFIEYYLERSTARGEEHRSMRVHQHLEIFRPQNATKTSRFIQAWFTS